MAQTKPQQVIIKMSATRELRSESDHVGMSGGRTEPQTIVEMAPHSVTIIKDAGTDDAQAQSGGKGEHCAPAKS